MELPNVSAKAPLLSHVFRRAVEFRSIGGRFSPRAWIRYLLPSIPAAGYMVLANTGDDDVVLSKAASPACGMLMLHKSQDDSGMAMMMDLQSVTIPAHGSVTFAPGGYHLMCMQPSMKIGEKIPVVLTFQDGATLATTMSVYGAQNAP
jgi:copper(I)-binding protein